MCQHIEPKGNMWYFRRRIPRDFRELHKKPGKKKAPAQIYFSLKTANKAEPSRLSTSLTRHLDALWEAHMERQDDPKRALAQLQAAGLRLGDGAKYADLHPVTNFIDDLFGRVEPWEERPEPSLRR